MTSNMWLGNDGPWAWISLGGKMEQEQRIAEYNVVMGRPFGWYRFGDMNSASPVKLDIECPRRRGGDDGARESVLDVAESELNVCLFYDTALEAFSETTLYVFSGSRLFAESISAKKYFYPPLGGLKKYGRVIGVFVEKEQLAQFRREQIDLRSVHGLVEKERVEARRRSY